MLTVKHVIDRGNEAVYSGTHVLWHEQATSDDPQETALVLLDRDTVVETFRARGVVYVVNEHGKTVAHYALPVSPRLAHAGTTVQAPSGVNNDTRAHMPGLVDASADQQG